MTESTPKNVVSLDDYGQQRKGLTPASATDLMRECRRRVTERLGAFVSTTMDKVDDALFACAEKAESNTQQTHYFDAMREVRLKRASVEARFRETFATGFTKGIARAGSDTQPTTPFGGSLNLNWDSDHGDDLGLVNHEQLEESLAITNMATKLRSNCNTLLYALDQRIGTLLNDPELERWQNPVGPDAICNAFKSASEVIETGIEIRLIILKLFDQFVVGEVRSLYQDLNKFLVDNGVLPEIRAKARIHPHSATTPALQSGPAADTQATTAGIDPAGTGQASAQYLPQGVISHHPAAGAAVVNTLTLLQRGNADLLNASLAGTDAANWDPRETASGTVNILTGLRQAGIAQDLGKSGDMTIDIVAMLFDYILDDRNIQDAMRALIGRLQIPVLKVALLDRGFFAKKSHPARRLLNGLAAIALGWSDPHDTDDPVYRKVSDTVQRILDEFEDDIGLFDTLARDLEAFVAEETERARMRAERSTRIAEGRERVEVAKTSALDEVQQTATPGNTTQLVQDFVSGHWKNLLFVVCAQHGKDSAEWKSAVQTMRDLIWSVKPKHNVEDRKRLAGLQNDLLQRLRMGMAQLSIPAEEQKTFLTQLVRVHGRTATATAIDATETRQCATAPDNPGFAGRAVEAVLASRQVSLEEINRKPAARPAPESTAPRDEFDQCVAELKEGQWLELTGKDGAGLRAKLSWISPITGTYLFTDRQGLKAAEMDRGQIAQALRSQQARVLDDAPLLDRAVSTVLKDYARQDKPAS